jgi:hypothetical protein
MMTVYVKKGTWVEIHKIILEKDERAPQVPDDTKQVPLEMKVKGFLAEDAIVGAVATIKTPTGRTLNGTLTEVNPAYTHQFGPPIPELLPIGKELREILGIED